MIQLLKQLFSKTDDKHVIVKVEINGEFITIDVNEKRETTKGTILFNKNEIIIGSDDGIVINSLEQDTTQEIIYQGITHKLTREELFSIFLMQIMREIEKEFVIDSIDLNIDKKATEHEKMKFIKSV